MSTVKLTIDVQPSVAIKVLNLLAESKNQLTPEDLEEFKAQVIEQTATALPVESPVAPMQQTLPNTTQQAPIQTPPTFTIDQIAIASTAIMDAGRQADLVALLTKFGVQALTQLPKEQFGAFATELRQLGAKI